MIKHIDLCKIFDTEDGQLFSYSGTTYTIKNNVLYRFNGATHSFQESSMFLNCVNKINSDEITYHILLKPYEQVILKSLPENMNWLARDKNGDLYVFEAEPHKKEDLERWVNNVTYNECKIYDLTVFNHMFRFVQYEDLKPFPITEYLESFTIIDK